MVDNNKVLNYGLSFLRIAALHPLHHGKINTCFIIFYIILSLFLCFLSIVIFTTADEFEVYVKYHASATTFGQFFLKVAVMLYHRKDFMHLLQEIERFWKIDDFPKEIKDPLQRVLTKTQQLLRLFTWVSSCTFLIYILRPFYSKKLPLLVWIPNKYFLNYTGVLMLEYIFLFVITVVIVGFDMLFVAMCVCIIVQLKLVNYHFSIIKISADSNIEEIEKEIIVYIRYHAVLVRFVNKMVKLYSIAFLVQYFFTIIAMCMELIELSISMSKSNFKQSAGSIVYCVNVLFQLAFYCFPAAAITEEANRTSECIYNTRWYENSSKLKTYVMMIILRCHQGLYFKAGGLLPVNRERFTDIFKTSLSFYSLLKVIVEDS